MTEANEQINKMRNEFSTILQKGDVKAGQEVARQALEVGISPTTFFLEVIQPLMTEVGRRFERLEIFLPELMKAAKVVKGVQNEVLEPALIAGSDERAPRATVIIGACKGDIHDIGKNMVALMLNVNGFEVVDLGIDVSTQSFIDAARKHNAKIIGMSSLLTTSMPYMADLIKRLEGLGLRDQYKVIVGGAPVTTAYAERIGADAYGADAVQAVKLCDQLVRGTAVQN
jgi:methylmalonyl-CoA mutase cobalamin-binding domain/chain